MGTNKLKEQYETGNVVKISKEENFPNYKNEDDKNGWSLIEVFVVVILLVTFFIGFFKDEEEKEVL